MEETKICSKCKENLTLDNFYKAKGHKYGVSSYCKPCEKENKKQYVIDNKELIQEKRKEYYEKNKEHISKQTKEYRLENPEKISERGRAYRDTHKEQISNRMKGYYEENVDKISETHKAYREENHDKCLELGKEYRINNVEKEKVRGKIYRDNHKEESLIRQRKWRSDNKDKVFEWHKKYNERNKEKITINKRIYRKANKDLINAISQRRRAKKLLLLSTFTIEEWESTKHYFDSKCCYCGEELPLQQEHFISVSKGGGYVDENMLPSCKSCNCSKNDKDFSDWYPSYKFYNREREIKILEYLNNKLGGRIIC